MIVENGVRSTITNDNSGMLAFRYIFERISVPYDHYLKKTASDRDLKRKQNICIEADDTSKIAKKI